MGRNRLPPTSGRLKFDWLQDDVTIYRDRWGIPHITAKSRPEMYFAQGVVHAQDRLWQLEMTRRTAAGTLAAVLGADALPVDRLTRTLGFGRLAKDLWPKLPQQIQEDIWSYTAGINAFLETNTLLPVEFRLLKHQPEPWHVLDSVAIGRLQAWAMNRGWSHELVRARLQQLLGSELLEELDIRPDQHTPLTVPEFTINHALAEAGHQLLGKGLADGSGLGSNSWVIGPTKSTTGQPILANDIHLPLSAPGTWYHVHQQYTN
ncbi:MAG: penicillin acylase family protein, partial [Anaerolineales bacterium]|nr:penicillin acylase family protein [Anaerolineales bacterium]